MISPASPRSLGDSWRETTANRAESGSYSSGMGSSEPAASAIPVPASTRHAFDE